MLDLVALVAQLLYLNPLGISPPLDQLTHLLADAVALRLQVVAGLLQIAFAQGRLLQSTKIHGQAPAGQLAGHLPRVLTHQSQIQHRQGPKAAAA